MEYDFYDGVVLGNAIKRINASKAMYYIDCDRMIRIMYNKKWVTYAEAVEIYPEEFTLS